MLKHIWGFMKRVLREVDVWGYTKIMREVGEWVKEKDSREFERLLDKIEYLEMPFLEFTEPPPDVKNFEAILDEIEKGLDELEPTG